MAPKRGVDLRKQKERRQKLIVLVGGIVLLGLLAIQGPKTLSRLRGGSTAAAQPAAVSTPAAGATAPASSPPPTAFVLREPDESASISTGQLASLDRFTGKDPFVQQVSLEAPAVSASTPASPAAATPQASSGGAASKAPAGKIGTTGKRAEPPASPSTTASPAATGTAPAPGTTATPGGSTVTIPAPGTVTTPAPGTTTPGSTTTEVSPGAASPVSTTVLIATNGKSEQVTVGGEFPKADPIFRLVSVSEKGARIAIAGGSYATGTETMPLVPGKLLTLMNTATGARYELRLLPAS